MKDFFVDLGLRIGMLAIDLLKKKYGVSDENEERNFSDDEDEHEYDPDGYSENESGDDKEEDGLTDDELYDLKKGKEKKVECPKCKRRGTFRLIDGCYVCDHCTYMETERNVIMRYYGREFEHEYAERYFSEDFETAFTNNGDSCECPVCGNSIVWDKEKGMYHCRECDIEFTREEFFDEYDIDIPGQKCLTCDENCPCCESCPYGYDVGEDEDDED